MRIQIPLIAFLAALLLSGLSMPLVAAESREVVREAWNDLDEFLGRGLRARGWRKYLLEEDLATQLRLADPRPDDLRRILVRYQARQPGLELPPFARVRRALESWVEERSLPPADALPTMARSAPASLRPLSSDELRAAAARLETSLAALNQFLAASPDKQSGWRRYLGWDQLHEQLGAEKPDLRVLKELETRFYQNHVGLERPEFLRVRESLRAWAETAVLVDNPDFENRFTGWLNELADQLVLYREAPTVDAAITMGRTLGWLERAGQARGLVSGIRSHYSAPNVVARVSQDFMAAGIEDVINEPTSVRQTILGTSITGHGRIQGNIQLEFLPDDERAAMEIVLAGAANTTNVGYKGPVTIYSSGTTELLGRKRLYIDVDGVHPGEAAADCDTRSRIHNIVARLRLIRRIAWKKAGQQQGQAERIASRRAEAQVAERMNREAGGMLEEVNRGLMEKIRGPLLRLGAFPQQVKMSTTNDYFFTRVLQAEASQLAAPGPAPAINEHCDLALRMHHSSANNFAESLLAGRTLTDEQLAEYAEELTGEVPEELKITEESDPWSITFPAAEPVRVEFGTQEVLVAIRGRQFTRGDSVLNKLVDIRAVYKVETSDAGVRLVRQGEVELEYVGRRTLSVADVTFKTFLLKKFNALFRPEFKFQDLALPGRWERAGSLQVATFTSEAGWLSTDWNLAQRDQVAQTPSADVPAAAAAARISDEAPLPR